MRFFFIKQEDGRVHGALKSLKYKALHIPSGGLDFPPLLKGDFTLGGISALRLTISKPVQSEI